jgi:signal transduction histidine kinase
MRRRLMLAMVGLVAVGLVVAGAGGLILTRNAARNDAKNQLVNEVQSLTSHGNGAQTLGIGSQTLRELSAIRKVLKLEDADFVRIDRLGNVRSPLPDGLSAEDLDVAALQSGQTVSGRKGNLVYAAAPVPLSVIERINLKNFEGTLAVLLTTNVGGLGPSWGYFLVAGGAALLVAAVVAWQMSRRMARPLVEAMEATGRIASGEFDSRVPIRRSDYAEFSRLAGSINDMAQRLEDGRTRERHLLLAVSHDLRTPLTSIRGFAEAIKDRAIENNDEAADVIIAESRRLERLVGDLLDLTKLEARQVSINMRPTDAAEVVGTTTEGFRPAAARNGLRILTDLPAHSSGAPVAADPDRLAQLLANLLENAITFARTTVGVRVTDGVGACVITIDDDGPGIAQGDLVRVFERFYRADRGPNRRIGSGLGLAIVAELAAAMGGTVLAESPTSADGGSRFVLTLRRWPQPVPQTVLT